ncbi:leukocyte surface antigen CD53-like [Coccinella septempunctata]|uniref:leukocyte surface antigen CD53-like n=1 Tax=Coccinella septempunctata TaxID=41139 RepID=UPI001D05FC00|nr:leukocyte surface antigen CD53-like [Coccinella septempunctata]
MGFCNALVKCLLIVFNILFGVWGLLGCAFSVFCFWLLANSEFFLPQDRTNFIVSVAIILIASIVLVLVAFIGIYGTINNSQCLLLTFFSLLLMVCVVEWAAAMWASANAQSLETQIHTSIKMTVEQEYGDNSNRTLIFDTIQKKLECCGADKPTDWAGNGQLSYTITSHTDYYKIPESCCRPEATFSDCQTAIVVPRIRGGVDYNVIYDRGCYDRVISIINENAYVILSVLASILFIQLVALVFSLVLAYMASKANRFKA